MPEPERHFIDHLECGHDHDTYACVGEPDDLIATMMGFAWAVPCYDCPKVAGRTAIVKRLSFEFVGFEERA